MNDEAKVVEETQEKNAGKHLNPKVKKAIMISLKVVAIIGTGVLGYFIGRRDGVKAATKIEAPTVSDSTVSPIAE
jgi:hypothetical protein